MASTFLTAQWRDLVMLNYEADPELLRPLVPAGVELDSWRARTFVSVVGFRFLQTRVWGAPIPFHRNFEEVNLRFYVRRRVGQEERRGVVFVKEIVPRWTVAWAARFFYNENYVAFPMRHRIDWSTSGRGEIGYEWRSGAKWCRLSAEVEGQAAVPCADSEESFIAEHYWGYARQRNGSTLEYQVEHPPWQVWRASACRFDCEVETLYGAAWASTLKGVPSSAFVADGSPVAVRRGVPI